MKTECILCDNVCEAILKFQNYPDRAQLLPDEPNSKGIDFDLFQCTQCGLTQLNITPVPYYKKAITTANTSYEMSLLRNQQLSKLELYYGKSPDFIDIGSSLSSLTKQNFNYHWAKTDGFVEDHFPVKYLFDGFVMFNYFEHYPDPVLFLNNIRKILKENAVGIIEVPNFDMILQKKLYSEIIPDHLFYFTEKTLQTTLELGGFEVLEKEVVRDGYILSFVVMPRRTLNLQNIFELEKKTLNDSFDREIPVHTLLNKRTAFYGAGHQAFSALSLLSPRNLAKIDCVFDDAEFKQNKYTPATNKKIVKPDLRYDTIILSAGSYSYEIFSRLTNPSCKSKIYILENNKLEKLR